jgi:hypothetical protein
LQDESIDCRPSSPTFDIMLAGQFNERRTSLSPTNGAATAVTGCHSFLRAEVQCKCCKMGDLVGSAGRPLAETRSATRRTKETTDIVSAVPVDLESSPELHANVCGVSCWASSATKAPRTPPPPTCSGHEGADKNSAEKKASLFDYSRGRHDLQTETRMKLIASLIPFRYRNQMKHTRRAP